MAVPYALADPLPTVPPTHLEQNYERLYVADADDAARNDHFLYLHAAGLCLVGLAPAHGAFSSGGGPGEPAAVASSDDGATEAAEGAASAEAGAPPGNGSSGAETAAAEAATEAGGVVAGAAADAAGAGAASTAPAATAAAAAAAEAGPSINFNVGRRSLLDAEFKKGRGPWLNEDAALCRQVPRPARAALRCCLAQLLQAFCASRTLSRWT